MTETTYELTEENMKKLLRLFTDATELLEQIPQMQDQGRLSEVSQHIGAELEARITQMNEIENDHGFINQLLNEIHNDQINENTELSELEKEVLG